MHSFKDLTITVFRKTPTLKVYHHAYFQRSHYNSIQENTNIKEDTKGRSFMGPFNRNLMKMNSWKLFIPFLLKKKLFVVVVEVLPFFFIKKKKKKLMPDWVSWKHGWVLPFCVWQFVPLTPWTKLACVTQVLWANIFLRFILSQSNLHSFIPISSNLKQKVHL